LRESIIKFSENNFPGNIFAFIKKNNLLSINSFQKAGFSIIEEEVINGIESYKLKYV
jgi:hypothetical protein